MLFMARLAAPCVAFTFCAPAFRVNTVSAPGFYNASAKVLGPMCYLLRYRRRAHGLIIVWPKPGRLTVASDGLSGDAQVYCKTLGGKG